jgi:hypothetical protein
VIRGLQSKIFFSECDGNFGPLWPCGWAIIDDGVHRSEVIVSQPFVSNSIVDPPVMGMIVPKEGKAFGV